VGNLEERPTDNAACQGETVGEPDPVAELVEAFPCCDSPQTFAAVIEQYSHEAVEAAIALQPNPLRQQLQGWFHGQLAQPQEAIEENPTETLIKVLESCQDIEEFTEVCQFYQVPGLRSPSQKEELIEAAILYARSEIKPKWRKWWDSTLYQIRDFWQFLCEQELLSVEGN
jgi:hypothetical protein